MNPFHMNQENEKFTSLEETAAFEVSADSSFKIGSGLVSEPTVGEVSDEGLKSDSAPSKRNIRLQKGSAVSLSSEIDQLYLSRIRLASGLLFFGNFIFLVYGFLFRQGEETVPLGPAIFWTHNLMTLLTGVIAFRSTVCIHSIRAMFGKQEGLESGDEQKGCQFKPKLFSLEKLTGWHLHGAEILIFGGSACFFFLFNVSSLLETAEFGFVVNSNGPWMLLIITYSLFMPHHWRRAAYAIVPLAVCPVLAVGVVWVILPSYAESVGSGNLFNSTAEIFLSMTFVTVIALFGVHTIRSLRTEAFRAKQLGQYRLADLLGSGGMGDVYRAEHLLMKRSCAIKVIREGQARDRRMLKRFEREVRQTARLRHWNTVDIYDYGHADDGTFFYVMEYLSGMNLQEVVEKSGPLSEPRVLHILSQVCNALSEAHSLGLVHRDVKPANIFLTNIGKEHDVVKLLDFGLVRPIVAEDIDLEATGKNVILGSPLFMPPEQASGKEVDARSDLYALGVVAYFLLTGKPPFEGGSALKVINDHINRPAPELSERYISPEFKDVVTKCLQKRPEDRFPDADSLQKAIQACQKSHQWLPEESTKWWGQYGESETLAQS